MVYYENPPDPNEPDLAELSRASRAEFFRLTGRPRPVSAPIGPAFDRRKAILTMYRRRRAPG